VKKTRIQLLLVSILALFFVLPLAAGGKQEAGKQELVFWNGYTGPDRPAVEQIAANFAKANPDINFKMEIMPWDSLWQKLMPALIAGSGPDIMGYSVSRLPEFAKAGRLEPLDGYFANSSLDRSKLIPGLMAASTYQGKLYGVPMAFAAMCMYYNKDHFKEAGLDPENPPKTMDELLQAWKKLLKKDGAGNVVRYPQAWGVKSTVAMIPVVIWNHGGDIVGKDGKGALDSPETIKALTFMQEAFLTY